jgi:hypothetical protein
MTTNQNEFRGFYFSVNKAAEAMTADECEYEIGSYETYESLCREIGQGINSKEFVRANDCRDRLREIRSERYTDAM